MNRRRRQRQISSWWSKSRRPTAHRASSWNFERRQSYARSFEFVTCFHIIKREWNIKNHKRNNSSLLYPSSCFACSGKKRSYDCKLLPPSDAISNNNKISIKKTANCCCCEGMDILMKISNQWYNIYVRNKPNQTNQTNMEYSMAAGGRRKAGTTYLAP